MSCSPFDLRDYFLKELPEADRRQVAIHVQGCQACREEVERLGLTEAALFSLRDEEIPQRIAFVSDKVFEPSLWRRWWAAFWGSSARLGFASAAMLSIAILVSALTRPAPAPVGQANLPQVSSAGSSALAASEIDRRVQAAVERATAEMESRQAQKTEQLVSAIERRNAEDRRRLMLVMEENLDYLRKRTGRLVVAAGDYGPPRTAAGEVR